MSTSPLNLNHCVLMTVDRIEYSSSADPLPRSGDVIHPQLWKSGSGYETSVFCAVSQYSLQERQRDFVPPFSFRQCYSTQPCELCDEFVIS